MCTSKMIISTYSNIPTLFSKSYHSTSGFGVGDGFIQLGADTSGVIFWLPINCNKVNFNAIKTSSNGYLQYGTCEYEASLPTVITEGKYRGSSWVGTNEDGLKYIYTNCISGCFFIGGNGFKIINISIEGR